MTAARTQAIIDGEPVDIGFVGDVVAVDPTPVTALLEAGHIPVVSSVAPDADRPAAQPQRRHRRRRARRRAGRGEARRPHRRRGALRRLARPRLARRADRRPRAGRDPAGARRRDGPEDGRLPAGGRGRGEARDRRRRPHAARPAAGDVHDRGHRDDGRPGRPERGRAQHDDAHRGAGRPLVGRDDEQLQDPAGRAGPRRRARPSGTSTAASTPTCSAASRRRSSATRTRRSSRRSPRRRRSSGTSPTWRCTSPGLTLAERLLDLAGRPGRGLLLQLRRRGQRGGVQDQPAHRPARGDHRRGRLPRPDDGRAGPHRPAVEGRRVRAAARRRAVRAVRGRRGAGRRGRRADRDGAARADAGRGRRAARAGRLPGRRRVGRRGRGRAVRRRRGADRHRPHRLVVHAPGRRRRSPT